MNEQNWVLNQSEWEIESRIFRDRIEAISDYITRRDLWKLFTSLDSLHLTIIREENNCKISKRQSNKHILLLDEFYQAKQNLSEQMTFGLLCL